VCKTCERVESLSVNEALEAVAAAIRSGCRPEHFKPVLDQLLGTELPERDRALESIWERGRRR